MQRGFFITFEGIDFSGKSAQATMLRDQLRAMNHTVVFLREPGGTEISEKIRDVLLDTKHKQMSCKAELLLYAAARAQIVAEKIAPNVQAGNVVICDRYFDSTTAYQGYGRQIDLEFIDKLHTFVINQIRPDLTFLIDLAPEEALRRKRETHLEKDRLDQEDLEFHKRVRDGYLRIANKEKQRFVIVDGSQSLERIKQEIFNVTRSRLKL